jgi:uncharacterized membrane protein
MKSFSINEALSVGWEAFKARVGFFIGLLILFGLILVIPQVLIQFSENDALTVVLGIAVQLLEYFLTVGLIKISLEIVDGGQPEISDLFSGCPVYLSYVLATLLYSLALGLGLLLLVVPGLFAAIVFGFYGYVIVEKGYGPIEALKASFKLTEGVRWNLLGFGLLLVLINFLGALIVGLGLLVTLPITFVATAFVYRKLVAQTPLLA